MRLSFLSVLLLGCGTANAPETTNNTNAPAAVWTASDEDVKSVTTMGEIVTYEFWDPSPVSFAAGNIFAKYDLTSLMEGRGCKDSNATITIASDFKTVAFSCIDLDKPLTFWRCDLPLQADAHTYMFEFSSSLADDIYSDWFFHDSRPKMPPWSHIDVRELSSELGCDGHDLSIVFWATGEGANTLCSDDKVIDRGFGEIIFPSGAATIFLDR